MDKKDKILAVISFIFTLCLNIVIFGGITYVLIHFISKFW